MDWKSLLCNIYCLSKRPEAIALHLHYFIPWPVVQRLVQRVPLSHVTAVHLVAGR